MKRLIALVLTAMVWAAPALAEDFSAVAPAGAAVEQMEAAVYRLTVEPTGEVLLLTVDEDGEPVSLVTEVEAASAGGEATREGAETTVRAEYPSGRVLASEVLEDGGRTLAVLADNLCGTVTVRGEAVVGRTLEFGAFAEAGFLTEAGARAALGLLRPGAELAELERDEDNGLLVYEGEAFLGGVEYEFELSAQTGRLLEWEAD